MDISVPLKIFKVNKPPIKQKMLEQTPVGMANATPSEKYVGMANATPSEKYLPKGHKKAKKKFK